MKKKVFSLMMTLVLAFMGVARAQEAPLSYDFESGTFQGWTTIDANHDGYDWMTTTSLLNSWGINLFGGFGHDDSQFFLASQSRDFWHLFLALITTTTWFHLAWHWVVASASGLQAEPTCF